MPIRADPSALRWLIGVQLTNYRKRAGKTMAEGAAAIGCSPGKVGHLESGRKPAAARRDHRAAALLRRRPRRRRAAGRTGRQRRPADLVGAMDRRSTRLLRTFVGLEGLAFHLADHATAVFPALLQPEDYSLGLTTGSGRGRTTTSAP